MSVLLRAKGVAYPCRRGYDTGTNTRYASDVVCSLLDVDHWKISLRPTLLKLLMFGSFCVDLSSFAQICPPLALSKLRCNFSSSRLSIGRLSHSRSFKSVHFRADLYFDFLGMGFGFVFDFFQASSCYRAFQIGRAHV